MANTTQSPKNGNNNNRERKSTPKNSNSQLAQELIRNLKNDAEFRTELMEMFKAWQDEIEVDQGQQHNESKDGKEEEYSFLPMVENWAKSTKGLGLSLSEIKDLAKYIKSGEFEGKEFKYMGLTKSVHVPVPLNIKVRATSNVRASTIFKGIAMDRQLIPGAYVVIGGPKSGKSALIDSIKAEFSGMDISLGYLSIFEPTPLDMIETEELSSLTLWEEIEEGLSCAFMSDLEVILIDSLRFLNAASPYPAKAKGINSGLEIYATLLNSIAERSGKIIFAVLSTSDTDPDITRLYQALMVGSAQGIIAPSRLQSTQIGTKRGEGEVSLRNGSRENQSFQFNTKEVITGPLVLDSTEVLQALENGEGSSLEAEPDSDVASRFINNIQNSIGE